MTYDAKQVQELFGAAIRLSPTEQFEFLRRECGDNSALVQHLEILLEAQQESVGSSKAPTTAPIEASAESTVIVANVGDPQMTIITPPGPSSESTFLRESVPSTQGLETANSDSQRSKIIDGRYSLIQLLGEGGMGEVWIAQQSQPVKRRVAVKLIKGGMDSKAVIARFEGERQALAMMDHPHIARVLDGGLTDDRRPYFVMELVDGLPLTKACDQAGLTIRQRLELFVSICQAVQHAHQKGLIHRDLKPGNILVGQLDGHLVPKVIDFGLAKATEGKLTDESLATNFGAVVGTLDYMSPEQAGLTNGDIDTRADIYSLGVILYELLTGLRPLYAKQRKNSGLAEIIRIIQQDEPLKPSVLLSGDASLAQRAAILKTESKKLLSLLQGELDWVVMKCLEKSRERRYETADALARDVARYLADEPVEARPPSTSYRMGKFLQRNKGPVVAAGIVVLSLIGGIVGTAIGLVRATHAEGISRQAAVNADTARQAAEKNERDAKRQLAHGLLAQGDALSSTGRNADAYGRYREAYGKFVDLKEPLVVAEAALWELARQHSLPLMKFTTEHLSHAKTIAIAKDNRTAIVGGHKKICTLFDLATGRELRTFTGHTDWIHGVVLSPNGDSVLTASADKTLKLWSLETGNELRTFHGHSGAVWSLAISPDGQSAISGSQDRTLKLWDLKSGDVLKTFEGHTGGVSSLAMSADGRTVISASHDLSSDIFDESLIVWDLTSGEMKRTFPGHTEQVHCVAMSADGRTAVTASADKTLKVWDLENGKELRTLSGHLDAVVGVAITPDGQSAVSAGSDGSLKYWDLSSGKTKSTLLGQTEPMNCVAISPDGRVACSGSRDGPLSVWDLNDVPEQRTLKGHTGPVRAIAMTPDGRTAVSGSWDTSTRVWDLASGDELFSIGGTGAVAITPDGRSLLMADADRTLKLYHLVTGEMLRTFPEQAESAGVVAISPDGRTALAGYPKGILKQWDLISGKELREFKGSSLQINCVAFSSDGQSAFAGKWEGELTRWDLSSGQEVHTFKLDQGTVWSVSISADDRSVLSADDMGTLTLWNLVSGNQLLSITGHRDQVWGASMTADGRHAVSGGFDRIVKLWDLTDGRELRAFNGHEHMVSGIVISPDARTVLSGGFDGTIFVWDFFRATKSLEFDQALATAKFKIGQNVNDAEALATLGAWYAFRGKNDWSIESLERAREHGASIPAETIARCHWKLGRFDDAQREFQTGIVESKDEANRNNLALCLRAVQRQQELELRRQSAAAAQPLMAHDLKRISELPATEQVAEIQKELKRCHPQFNGVLVPTIKDNVVIDLSFKADDVIDIRSISALTGLQSLSMIRRQNRMAAPASDLTGLKGLSLRKLDLSHNAVTSLSALEGMPLEELNIEGTKVVDLAPLKGMPLVRLNLKGTRVADLSPLEGMPIESLNLDETLVTDLTLLAGMPLKQVLVANTRIVGGFEVEAKRLQEMGDLKGSLAVWRKAVEIYRIQDEAVTRHLGVELRRDRDLDGAIQCFEAFLKIKPDTWSILDELEDTYAAAGQLSNAIRVGKELTTRNPRYLWNWYRVSLLLAVTRDEAGHLQYCRQMIKQFDKSNDLPNVWATCTSCLLFPNSKELVRFAQSTITPSFVEMKLNPELQQIATFTRALLALRLGEAEAGLRLIDQIEQDISQESRDQPKAGSGDESRRRQTRATLALHLAYRSIAHRQLGQDTEANACIKEATVIFENLPQEDDSTFDRMLTEVLIHEARSLVKE